MNSFNDSENTAYSANSEYGSNKNNHHNYNANIPPVRPIQVNKGSNGCLLAVIFVLGFFTIFVFGGIYLLNSTAETAGKLLTDASGSLNLANTNDFFDEETLVDGDLNSRIAIIPITGAISGWGNAITGGGFVHDICRTLKRAAEDDTVKAVILQIDSPGGGLSASDIIYNEVLNLKNSGKKVVVYVGQLCASGGYYIAAPANYIVAGPTALVGSFGVIMQHVEVTGLLEKIGVVVDPIKSTNSKDIGSPFKAMTPAERDYFDHIITTYHNRFIEIIAKGRKLNLEKVAALADGKVFLATEALEYGLIDEIGYFAAGITQAKKACTVDNPQIFTYSRQLRLIDILQMESKSSIPSSVTEFLSENSGTDINLLYNGLSRTTDK